MEPRNYALLLQLLPVIATLIAYWVYLIRQGGACESKGWGSGEEKTMSESGDLDELLAKETPEAIERINEKADGIVLEQKLSEIRNDARALAEKLDALERRCRSSDS